MTSKTTAVAVLICVICALVNVPLMWTGHIANAAAFAFCLVMGLLCAIAGE